MKKTLSIMLICALITGLLLPATAIKTSAAQKSTWNTSRYGDVLDEGTYLRHLDKDEDFAKEAEKNISENAAKINFDGETAAEGSAQGSTFTYDGGTKYFLNRDLDFKEFTLRSVGDNIEIWVANDLSFPEGDSRPAQVVTQEQVDKLRDKFDDVIYPKDTSFFGTPDSHDGSKSPLAGRNVPQGYYEGNDKTIMLVDNIIDENYYDSTYPFFVAGFYWGTLEAYIDRNIITIDANGWATRLESNYYGTIAHEFQHLIHDDNDSMEETWINEGMADFAEYLCFGTHPMGHVNFFLDHPENSLVEWDEHYSAKTGPETLADYGQAYLLQLYLNDKYGMDFVKALATDGQDQGIKSVNKILSQNNKGIDFEELFRRFTIAVAIDSPQPGNGIYNFESINLNVNYASALTYDKDGVPAWGADYKELVNPSKIQDINIDGIDFMPTPWKAMDKDGRKVLWGNEGNEKANQLILKADLSKVSKATLKFDTLYDIEKEWDYGIVQVSTDNGKTWSSLANGNTSTVVDPNGYPAIKASVPGFTGKSGGWVNEEFDLTPYAGKTILINFNYMTDWGTNGTGWFIDNIAIPEIGYSNNCDSLEGFHSIDEILKIYVDYSLVFINQKSLGKGKNQSSYRVLNIDPMNMSDAEAIMLKDFLSGGKNYMIVWYAAPVGTKGTVDFTYKITTKSDFAKTHNKK
jgi:Uncharacterized protein conserved in bacteria